MTIKELQRGNDIKRRGEDNDLKEVRTRNWNLNRTLGNYYRQDMQEKRTTVNSARQIGQYLDPQVVARFQLNGEKEAEFSILITSDNPERLKVSGHVRERRKVTL